MCGASASTEATQCDHCGARLATVACPSCFGMVFLGAKFCAHCGARVDRTEVAEGTPLPCPRCRVNISPVKIGGADLWECPRCEGIWAEASAFEQICADREKQAAVLGIATQMPEAPAGQLEEHIRYVPCPACHKLMNRVNFAHCSSVIVDVCKTHGTWFDRDELRRIVEFIRAGGLEAARNKEIAELESRKRQLSAVQTARAWSDRDSEYPSKYAAWSSGISAAGSILKMFLR